MDEKNFWLHKFRDTAATWWLRNGVDLRTVSHWLGHASIEMTERYPAREQGAQSQRLMNRAMGNCLELASASAD
jgi:integrase